jgi:hypothetical protein
MPHLPHLKASRTSNFQHFHKKFQILRLQFQKLDISKKKKKSKGGPSDTDKDIVEEKSELESKTVSSGREKDENGPCMEELVNKLNSLEGQFALPKFC